MDYKTNKQKLIEYLYKYTSKELTFGCEAKIVKGTDGIDTDLTFTVYSHSFGDVSLVYVDGGRKEHVHETDLIILGHPPQWHHLLLALNEVVEWQDHNYAYAISSWGSLITLNESGYKDMRIELDLHTNLQDILEKDAEKLCKLLNLE